MIKRRRLIRLSLFAAIGLLWFAPRPVNGQDSSAAEVMMVRADGVSATADAGLARDEAIKDALRKATEQALGVYIESRSVTKNYQLLSDEIFTQSRGFVRTFRILVDKRGTDGILRVTVEAQIERGGLTAKVEKLADRLRLGNDPRLIIALEDENEIAKTVQGVLTDALTERGFRVMDADQSVRARVRSVASVDVNTGLDSAVRRALMPIADILIVGRIRPPQITTGNIGGVTTYRATAQCDLRAIQVDTGAIIVQKIIKAPAQTSLTSAEDAAEKAASPLVSEWLKAAMGRLVVAGIDPTRAVDALIQGLPLSEVTELESQIRRLRFVQNVRPRDAEGDIAQLEILWAGDARTLAVAIERLNPRLEAVANTANTILIKARSRKP